MVVSITKIIHSLNQAVDNELVQTTDLIAIYIVHTQFRDNELSHTFIYKNTMSLL